MVTAELRVAPLLKKQVGNSTFQKYQDSTVQNLIIFKNHRGTSLHISESAVKSNINQIFCRLGAKDRTQATIIALKREIAGLRKAPLLYRFTLMELEAVLEIQQLRYITQDETRIGRKTETKRVITSRGVKPKVKVQWPREAFWLYGVVEPLTGWQWTQEYRQLNQTNFQAFLNELSRQLGSSVAGMQIDKAPAHRAKTIDWPENIIPIFQPSHSPELNPLERLWQFLKVMERIAGKTQWLHVVSTPRIRGSAALPPVKN